MAGRRAAEARTLAVSARASMVAGSGGNLSRQRGLPRAEVFIRLKFDVTALLGILFGKSQVRRACACRGATEPGTGMEPGVVYLCLPAASLWCDGWPSYSAGEWRRTSALWRTVKDSAWRMRGMDGWVDGRA